MKAHSNGRKRSALQQGIAYLSRREYSRQELSRRLGQAGYEQPEIDAALERLVSEGWQDDARYAQAFTRMRANAGYGPQRIRHELQTKQVPDEWVRDALQPFDRQWVEIAADYVGRRYGSGAALVGDLNARRKAADFLLRRGFDQSTMRAALQAACTVEIT